MQESLDQSRAFFSTNRLSWACYITCALGHQLQCGPIIAIIISYGFYYLTLYWIPFFFFICPIQITYSKLLSTTYIYIICCFHFYLLFNLLYLYLLGRREIFFLTIIIKIFDENLYKFLFFRWMRQIYYSRLN